MGPGNLSFFTGTSWLSHRQALYDANMISSSLETRFLAENGFLDHLPLDIPNKPVRFQVSEGSYLRQAKPNMLLALLQPGKTSFCAESSELIADS
jgi:hypothetical protein